VVPQVQPAKNLPEGLCVHAQTYTHNQDTLKTQKHGSPWVQPFLQKMVMVSKPLQSPRQWDLLHLEYQHHFLL
jgi:hypothetical protein